MVTGIAGSVLPFLPGPPVSYAGLLLLQLSSKHPFTVTFLAVYGIITILAVIADYALPVYSAKRFKGSGYGVFGSALGMIAGIFIFPPFGIIIGTVTGAFIGELINSKAAGKAVKPAFGSFVGFLTGTTLKLILTVIMAYHYTVNLF
jgi:uncharacterized protein YqgC (DUF456 family)